VSAARAHGGAAPGPATAFAAALLTRFAELGIRDVVVSPGSRSQALALVAAALDRVGRIRLRVRVDERSAGFLALGLARESGEPVVVVTTSGTAVANLHPAVLEAHHSGVPLVVLTADRPEELHGIGSNQTTTHVGMFGEAVRRTWDVGAPTGEPGEEQAAEAIAEAVADAARGAGSQNAMGPVHLNVAFTEPLSGPWEPSDALRLGPAGLAQGPAEVAGAGGGSLSERSESKGAAEVAGADGGSLSERSESKGAAEVAGAEGGSLSERNESKGAVLPLPVGPRTAVIAGAGAGPRAEELARELGAVLLAEAVSGARFGPNLVVPYREAIRSAEFQDALERIVVFGRPTLSREVPWLIGRGAAETIVVRAPGADAYNPGHSVTAFADAVEATGTLDAVAARAWVGPWVAASRAWLEDSEDVAPEVFADARDKANRELDAVRRPVSRRALVEAVWRASWPHDRLVVAASRLVRELDRRAPGKAIPVHSNRGLAGIDGNTSTAIGIALASQGAADAGSRGITRLLTGDLAFLHDVGGLAFSPDEARPRILVVVGNDGGGTIFDALEVAEMRAAGEVPAADFDRVMLTPQAASIEGLARAYGWDYRRVDTRGELDPALTACAGPTVVEVPLTR